MDKRWMVALVTLAAGLAMPTWAGNSAGFVTTPLVHEGDVFMFAAGPHSDKPSCSGEMWAVSLRSEKGKAMMSLLLSAHAQGRRVQVVGFSPARCSDWADRETPMFAQIID